MAIGSIPGHATWTAISGYAIGHYVISKRWHERSMGVFDKSKNQQDSQWILFDGKSGQPMITSKTKREIPTLPRWLSAGPNKAFNITHNPFKAVGIAILFHALWNGSLWTISVIVKDLSVGIQIMANLFTIIFLIILLWTILRRLVPFAISEKAVMQK